MSTPIPLALRAAGVAFIVAMLPVAVASIPRASAVDPPEFMTFDSTSRTVRLTVTARYDESNGGFNLNGSVRGAHRVTVPVGWNVHVTFINRDRIEHSVVLVKDEGHTWARTGGPAIRGAESRSREAGIPPGGRDDRIRFVVRAPGAYLLACGVAGHEALGGYIRFVVSADARVPTYETARAVARA